MCLMDWDAQEAACPPLLYVPVKLSLSHVTSAALWKGRLAGDARHNRHRRVEHLIMGRHLERTIMP